MECRLGSSPYHSRVILPCASFFNDLLPLGDLPPSFRFPQAAVQLLPRCSARPLAWYVHFYKQNRDTPLEPTLTHRTHSPCNTRTRKWTPTSVIKIYQDFHDVLLHRNPPPQWPLEETSTQSRDERGILTVSSTLRAPPSFLAISPFVRYGTSSVHRSSRISTSDDTL